MNKSDAWPPPDWYEILIMWETMLKCNNKHPNDITEWCYRYPGYGCWHLHGFNSTEGFAFRFEDPRDATAFGLRWG